RPLPRDPARRQSPYRPTRDVLREGDPGDAVRSDRLRRGARRGGAAGPPRGAGHRAAARAPGGNPRRPLHPAHGGAMIRRLLLATLLLLGAAGPVWAASWGWLGVRIRDLSEQEMEEISQKHGLREGFGVLIVEVLKETPAATSGLANGDLVVAVRGRPVVDTRTLQRLVAATPVGEELPLTVLRRDKE